LLNHIVAKSAFVVENIMRDAQFVANAARIANVIAPLRPVAVP
jgi:hypothetical protein